MSTHENLRSHGAVKTSSDRSFGLVFAVVFLLVGLYPILAGGPVRTWSLAVAGGFLIVALLAPRVLAPLNRLWTRFGIFLHRIVSPIVLAAILYLVITPVAVVMRLLGKDPLRTRFDPDARSYWIEREPPGPPPSSMSRQF